MTDAQGDAVAFSALVAGQDVEPGDGPGQWRIAADRLQDRVISTVDPETRHTHKTRSTYATVTRLMSQRSPRPGWSPGATSGRGTSATPTPPPV